MFITEEDAYTQDSTILDIRTKEEHENLRLTAGHTHLPMHEIDLPKFVGEQNQPLFILCHVGGRAAQLAQILIQSGSTDTKVIEGGILACRKTEGPNNMSDEEIHAYASPSFQSFIARHS